MNSNPLIPTEPGLSNLLFYGDKMIGYNIKTDGNYKIQEKKSEIVKAIENLESSYKGFFGFLNLIDMYKGDK